MKILELSVEKSYNDVYGKTKSKTMVYIQM